MCRELTRVVRDMMLVSVDPARAGDGELAEGERERLAQLARRFSREDLMRAFDLLAKAETDIRTASHPRYHFEMALLRWMHLRKLVPLADLLEQLGGAGGRRAGCSRTVGGSTGTDKKRAPHPRAAGLHRQAAGRHRQAGSAVRRQPAGSRRPPTDGAAPCAAQGRAAGRDPQRPKASSTTPSSRRRSASRFGDTQITFAFLPTHRALRDQFEQNRPWLEAAAERLAGRRIAVVAVQVPERRRRVDGRGRRRRRSAAARKDDPAKRDLKAEAMSSSAVQAMLDVFPAEIRDVEEM